MPKRRTYEDLLNLIDNIGQSMLDKAADINCAADELQDLRNDLEAKHAVGEDIDIDSALGELDEIWSSVMETEFDEDY